MGKDWADEYGQLSISFVIPQSQRGSHVVRARDDKGNTAEATFTVESNPPAAPSLFTPRTGSQLDTLTPSFDWSDVQDLSGVTYSLELAHNDRFAPVVLTKTGLGASQYALAEAEKLEPGTYYWRVRAIDNAGNTGQWSFIFTFEAVAPGLSTGALIGVILGGVAIVGCLVYLLGFRLRKRTTK
jgi:predicted phage tail protein